MTVVLLVDIIDQDWMGNDEFRQSLKGVIPPDKIQFYPDLENAEAISMLACDRLRSGLINQLPNVRLIQKLGAGVETIVNDPDVPDAVRITRLKPQNVAMEMARYCLSYVLSDIHNLKFHRTQQNLNAWTPKEPGIPENSTIGVLGLGHIGGITANLFSSLNFPVMGWSRSEKSIDGMDCRWGLNMIDSVLSESDYVICILPSTRETENLINRERLNVMKPQSTIINVGRGTLIVEEDLINALDDHRIAHAVLDVFHSEPLLANSPLWSHPSVTITPHVSGWHLDGLSVVGENYNALVTGSPLTHEVSRNLGY